MFRSRALRTSKLSVSAIAFILLTLTACGGGGPISGGSGSRLSATSQGVEGVYSGKSSSGEVFESIVLPNDKFYVLYGTNSGNVFYIHGMMEGQGQSSSSTFTASVTDYYYNGSTYTGQVTATFVPGQSISGTVSEAGVPSVNFSGTLIAGTSYHYDSAALTGDIAGGWTAVMSDGSLASVTVNASGDFAGSDSGCTFTGKVVPDASNNNFFDVTLTYGPKPCNSPYQTLSGIALDYLLPDGITRQLVAGVSSGNVGSVFAATRDSGAQENPNNLSGTWEVLASSSQGSSGWLIEEILQPNGSGLFVAGSDPLRVSGTNLTRNIFGSCSLANQLVVTGAGNQVQFDYIETASATDVATPSFSGILSGNSVLGTYVQPSPCADNGTFIATQIPGLAGRVFTGTVKQTGGHVDSVVLSFAPNSTSLNGTQATMQLGGADNGSVGLGGASDRCRV